MAIIYCSSNHSHIAYLIDGGGYSKQYVFCSHGQLERSLLAISFGITEFLMKWQKELDARCYEGDEKVREPSRFTQREMPNPIEIRSDDELAVRLLSKQIKVNDKESMKLVKNIWQQCEHLQVRFMFYPENEAKKILL